MTFAITNRARKAREQRPSKIKGFWRWGFRCYSALAWADAKEGDERAVPHWTVSPVALDGYATVWDLDTETTPLRNWPILISKTWRYSFGKLSFHYSFKREHSVEFSHETCHRLCKCFFCRVK